ncbi:DNA-binding transcriptional LysR family regulator [Bradyrhizobium sp. USDA 4501]
MVMNLRQMEIFRAVMREGSITGAAKALNISQPSISEIIRNAEARCGLQFFVRDKGRLRPTPNASRLIDDIDAVFHQVTKVNRVIESLRSDRDVTLILGCTYSLSLSLAPKIISFLHSLEPKLKLQIVVERRVESANKVSSGSIDAAISFLAESYSNVEIITLTTAAARFICPKSHPLAQRKSVSVRDLRKERFVGYFPYLQLRKRIDTFFGEHGFPFNPAIEVEQIAQAWHLVRSGEGVAIVDPFCDLQVFFPEIVSVGLRGAPLIPLQLLVKKGRNLTPTLSLLASKFTELAQVSSREMP